MASTDQVNPKISPSDDEVVAAVEAIRTAAPELGREKVRARLITENNWLLSESRLKKLLAERGLESSVVRDQFIKYPANALQAQERYKADSTRCFKLYARGEHDFGVPPNCAQALKIDIAHQRLVEHGHPTSRSEAEALARSWPMQYMWDFYWAAAQKAGIAKADVGGQLKAEYGVNLIPYLPSPTAAQIEQRKAVFKRESLKLKREMLKVPGARAYIPVDSAGQPVWDESLHHEFAVIVVRIDKGAGLNEFSTV